jgi:hypothetical protein
MWKWRWWGIDRLQQDGGIKTLGMNGGRGRGGVELGQGWTPDPCRDRRTSSIHRSRSRSEIAGLAAATSWSSYVRMETDNRRRSPHRSIGRIRRHVHTPKRTYTDTYIHRNVHTAYTLSTSTRVHRIPFQRVHGYNRYGSSEANLARPVSAGGRSTCIMVRLCNCWFGGLWKQSPCENIQTHANKWVIWRMSRTYFLLPCRCITPEILVFAYASWLNCNYSYWRKHNNFLDCSAVSTLEKYEQNMH